MTETTAKSLATREAVPYKELDFFDERDRRDFAGRARDVDELIARIRIARAVVLYGRSGLGKTSLLRAGIFPVLREERFLPIYVRSLESPLDDLAAALRDPFQVPLLDPPASAEESVERLLARISVTESRTPVLVFDQFEEFFTRFALRNEGIVERQRRRHAFVNRICGLVVDAEQDVRIVFSLREDFLHTLDTFQRKLPDLFVNAYRLLPLTASGAREAIVAPLFRDKVTFDECFVTELIDELAEFDFESAHLQVACAETYRAALKARHRGNGSLSKEIRKWGSTDGTSLHVSQSSDAEIEIRDEDLAQIRDAKTRSLRGIFKNYLQAGIDNIPNGQHLLARQLLDQLFISKGTKYALELDKLKDLQFGTSEETETVLTNLTEQKLLRSSTIEGKVWFELRHECLVEPIEEWLNEHDGFAKYRLVRDIIKANAKGGRFRDQPQLLLSEEQLGHVSDNKERFRLEADERELVFLSAMRHCSPDIQWWADQIGREKANALIIRGLRNSNETIQKGAAEAAARLGPPFSDAAELTCELALNASDESTRRAARGAFARLADESQLRRVATKVRLFATSAPLRDLLADLYEQRRMQHNFSVFRRWLARLRWRKRQFDANIGMIRECGNAGLIAGLSTTALWLITCGVFVGVLAWGAVRPDMVLLSFAAAFAIVGSVILVVGTVSGFFLGQCAGQVSVLKASVSAAQAVRRSKFVALIFGIVGPWTLYWAKDEWRDSLWNTWLDHWTISEIPTSFMDHEWIRDIVMNSTFVAIHVFSFVLCAWTGRELFALFANVSRQAVHEGRAERATFLLGSIAVIILLPLLSLTSRASFFSEQNYLYVRLLLIALCVVIVTSFLLAGAVGSLRAAELAHRRPRLVRDASRQPYRIGIITAAIAAVAGTLTVFGLDTFPLPFSFLRAARLEGNALVARATFWVWPDSAIFAVRKEEWPLMRVASNFNRDEAFGFVGDERLLPLSCVFSPRGTFTLAIRNSSAGVGRTTYRVDLREQPVVVGDAINASTNHWTFAVVKMGLAESAMTSQQWVGTLHCNVDEALLNSATWLKIAPLAIVSSEDSKSPARVIDLSDFTDFTSNDESASLLSYPGESDLEGLRRRYDELLEAATKTGAKLGRQEYERIASLEQRINRARRRDYERRIGVEARDYYRTRLLTRGDEEFPLVIVRRAQAPQTAVEIVRDTGSSEFKTASMLLALCVEPQTGLVSTDMNNARGRAEKEPDSSEALVALQSALLGHGEFAETITVTEKIANLSPKADEVWGDLAAQLYHSRQWQLAIMAWKKVDSNWFRSNDEKSFKARRYFEDAQKQIQSSTSR